jgi:uncharacterized protein YjbI with pentapeptide repeats
MRRKNRKKRINNFVRRDTLNRIEQITRRMIFIFGITVVSLLISVGLTAAYTKADLKKLKTSKTCESCNLRGANLSKADLANANLSKADLTGANIGAANLSKADLSDAKLIDAVLSKADLSDAKLINANLSGAYLIDVNLSGADLSGAKWTNGVTCKPGSIGTCKK